MYGVVILFSNILADTFNSLMQRFFAKTYPTQKFSGYLIVNLLFFYPVGLLYAYIHRDQINFVPITKNDWELLLLIGITAGITYRFIMVVNHKVEASTQQIVGTLRIVGTLTIAALFLSEHLALRQYIGAAILVAASTLYVRTKGLSKNMAYILLLIFITLLFCICLVAEKYLISKYGLASYLPLGWGMQVLFLLILSGRLAVDEVRSTKFTRPVVVALILMGVLDACASITYVLSVNAWQSVSLVNAAHVFQAPLTVFLAIFLLKERDLWGRKVLAISTAALGLWLIL